MRKMYFAMIPKRSFLENAVIAAGVGAGVYYGAKKLLGEQQFNEYRDKLKNKLFDSGAKEFDASTATAEEAFADEDAEKARENADIMDRIRKAAAKGLERIV